MKYVLVPEPARISNFLASGKTTMRKAIDRLIQPFKLCCIMYFVSPLSI